MDEIDLDYDAGLDEPLDVHMSDLSMGNAPDAVPPESSPSVVPSVEAQTSRRYLSKRPHRKSRAGCKQCKRRKVKVLLSFPLSRPAFVSSASMFPFM